MDSCIGAFEAKVQLSQLLRALENGEQFTITVRGQPIADLVPHRSQPPLPQVTNFVKVDEAWQVDRLHKTGG